MGSTVSQRKEVSCSTRIIPREPAEEKFSIPAEEPGYPPARYPAIPTHDIYHPGNNREIYFHAIKAPKDVENSWDDLVHYLTSLYRTDIHKVRSIFTWLGLQDLQHDNFLLVFTQDSLEETTPRVYKKLIKTRKASYASMFALLCRKAGIPCAIISGISKGYGYEVGQKDVSNLQDRWNAVFIDGWRLIHPLWAYTAQMSYKKGEWVCPDSDSNRMEIVDVEENVAHVFNEYYFLVEPADFVGVCFPDKPKWQLCKPPLTLRKWKSIPHFMKMFYMEGFRVPAEFRSELRAKRSVCGLVIKDPVNKDADFQLAYDFFFNHNGFSQKFDEKLYLKRYVLMSRDVSNRKWSFEIRMPVTGRYRITVYGGTSSQKSLPCICELAVACEKPSKKVKPYPACPAIGFGPVCMTKSAGLLDPSHKSGMLFLKTEQTIHVTFKLDRPLQAKSRLIGEDGERVTSDKWMSCTINSVSYGKLLDIVVTLHEEGEYALKIYTRPKKDGDLGWKNVCNYFLSTKRCRPNGTVIEDRGYKTERELDADKAIEAARKGTDMHEIKSAIQRTHSKDHFESDGSFGKATMRMEYLELVKALKEAISLQNFETLSKVIKRIEVSDHAEKMSKLLKEAHEEKAKALQATLNEILNKPEASSITTDVLKATLILLGEDVDKLQTWEDVVNRYQDTGTAEILHNIEVFDTKNASRDSIVRAGGMLNDYNVETVKSESYALAAVYSAVIRITDMCLIEGEEERPGD